MSDGVGPFSMLAISALEMHVQAVTVGDQTFPGIRLSHDTITPAMIFCRGLLGYNDNQELMLRTSDHGGVLVKPGDWIAMVSRSAYEVIRFGGDASLFALIPDVPLCTRAERLGRIAEAHKKDVDPNGGTHGLCVECYQHWAPGDKDGKGEGCPTRVWATTARDVLATWDPADDEPLEGVADEA